MCVCVCVVEERVNGRKPFNDRAKGEKRRTKGERETRNDESKRHGGCTKRGKNLLDRDTPTTTARFLSKPALSFHANFKFRE